MTTDEQVQVLQAEVAQLKAQQALTVQFGKAFLEGHLDGPGSAKAFLLAIDPGLEITPGPFLIG